MRAKAISVLFLWVELLNAVAINVVVLRKDLPNGQQQSIYFISHHLLTLETIPQNIDYQQLVTLINEQIVVIHEFFQTIRSISEPLIIIDGVTRAQEASSELLRYQPFYCTCVFKTNNIEWCRHHTMPQLREGIDVQRKINSLLQLLDSTHIDRDVLVIEPKAYLNNVLDVFFMVLDLDANTVTMNPEKYQACIEPQESSLSIQMFIQQAIEVIDQLIKDTQATLKLLKNPDNKKKITYGKKYLLEQRKLWQSFKHTVAAYKEKPFIQVLMGNIFKNQPRFKNVSIFQLRQGIDPHNLAIVTDIKFLQFILEPDAPLRIIINTSSFHTLLMTEYLINEGYTSAFSSQMQCNWDWNQFTKANYQDCLDDSVLKALEPAELYDILIQKTRRQIGHEEL